MTAPAATRTAVAASRRARGFRPDIQALRAVAIALVVANHLWPSVLTGGYVGVDVFFVISGFLITGHLVAELRRDGRVRLGAFYARRIRRLLPAALLVLFVTIVGVWVLLPPTRWTDNALQTIASAVYVENWTLAGLSVDYSAHNGAASAVQHYWSLSVEEQFYLVWPVLLLAAFLLLARRRRANGPVTTRSQNPVWTVDAASTGWLLASVAGGVAAVSLTLSVLFTAAAPAPAYFVTFTRMWEFAAGALVALAPGAVFARFGTSVAAAVAVVGAAAIAVSAVLFDSRTPFPSAAALLPVLGTVLVLVAGTGRPALPVLSRVTHSRPVQWLGDVSYSLYLWHWPLIILIPFLLRHPLTLPVELGVLGVALVLAGVTRRLVEVPAQRSPWWRTTRRALLGMGAMMLVVVTTAGAAALAGSTRATPVPVGEPIALPAGVPADCAGPGALLPGSGCDPSLAVAEPVVSDADAYYALAPECAAYDDRLRMDDRQTTRECDFGDGPRVWLVGDSHAEQWQGALFAIARERGWRLTISTFPGCPAADVPFIGFDTEWGPVDYERCRTWVAQLTETLVSESPDLVITSMAARQQLVADEAGVGHDAVFADGLRRTWSRWTDAGIRILPIIDIPLNADVRDPDCVVLRASSPEQCAVPRDAALPPDPLVLATASAQDGVHPVDLSDRFCDAERCFAAVGGMPVYFDADHMSGPYAARLAPDLLPAIDRALSD